MNSPFTDFIDVASETLADPGTELESKGPFADTEDVSRYTFPETEEELMETEGGDPGLKDLNNYRSKINIEKATKGNVYYEKKGTWGSMTRKTLISAFASAGVVPHNLALDSTYFSLVVAKFQSLKGLSVDGMLGPATFDILKKTVPVAPPVFTPATFKPSQWRTFFPDAVQSPAEPLINGNEAFKEMARVIRTAKGEGHFIYLLSGWVADIDFCLSPNESKDLAGIDTSSTLRSLLTTAAAANVEIKILSWNNPKTLSELAKGEKFMDELRASGKNAIMFRDNFTYGTEFVKKLMSKLRGLIGNLSKVQPSLNFFDFWKELKAKAAAFPNQGSHHEKILVVNGSEGLIAFTGGMDINANRIIGLKGFCCGNYFNPAHNCDLEKDSDNKMKSGILHDVHCKLRGRAAEVLLQRFIQRWNLHISQFPYILKMSDHILTPVTPMPADTPYVKVLHTFNHPVIKSVTDRSILNAVETLIKNAKTSIVIEDQYMISPEIADWLKKAVKANGNLKVSLYTQDDEFAGELMFAHYFRQRFHKILYSGLNDNEKRRIDMFMLDPQSEPPGRRRVHSKTYIIDGEIAIIGSANCNRRSMTFDSETSVIIFQDGDPSQSVVKKLNDKIRNDRYNKWIAYKENFRMEALDWDVRVKMNPYFNTTVSILSIPMGVGAPLTAWQVIQNISILLREIIDPHPDGEPVITKEVETELAEIMSESEALPDSFSESGLSLYEEEKFPVFAAADIISETSYEEETPASKCNCHKHTNVIENLEREMAEIIVQQAANVNKSCEGHTCWAKTILNKLLGTGLAINNLLDEPTKKAISNFQLKNNLPQTRMIDAVTERVMLEADAIQKNKGTPSESTTTNIISSAKTKIEDWTVKGLSGVKNKPQHILNSFRDPRKVWAFVLHHMAFKRKGRESKQYSDPTGYVNTGAHFCIMLDGRIIQLHPMSRMIWHGNCISPRSVAVEFEGNFPNVKGKWWIDRKSTVQNKDIPTQAQYDSGRFLASYLKIVLGTTHILAHRQSSDSRENDPGPDIWYNVGEWAISNLGMTDGGPTFKCGTGNTILPEWRTWGDKTSTMIKREYDDMEEEVEWEDTETESMNYEPIAKEYETETEEFEDEDLKYDETGEEKDFDVEQGKVVQNPPDMLFKNIQNPAQPVILARAESTIPVSNEMLTFYKMYDKVNKKFINEYFDEQGNKITQSEIRTKENEVPDTVNNKIHPTLQLQILKVTDAIPIDIAVWLNLEVKEPLKTNYRPEELATMPAEIADYRRKLAVTIGDTARKVTIERSGIQVQRVSDLLPLFFAKATKRTIDLIKNDPLVLGIFFNDRSYYESLSTSLSRSGAAEAQTAGMTNLGKDIKVAVWENAPDLLTNLTIEGYYDPATPNVSNHSRLVCAIIKNKEPGKSKGYAPNCKLYSANLSGTDVFAPLEWAVKQGCTVINRSFHQSSDQVNAGMQLSDFITDALALRYPYPMIVQASGNTGQPDDTASGITPPGNEYVNHKGYNSIAVGSHDEQTERRISSFSTFRNPSSPHSDRELPEICALGEKISAVGLTDWGGTSFASPAVAGSVTLLQSLSPIIKLFPEVTRALLLAGSKRNVDGGLWYEDLKRTPKVDQKDGTGALNIYESITIAKKPYQPKKVALDKGWDYGKLDASSFGPDKISTREWKIIVPQNRKHVKIALAWNSNANYAEIWFFRFLKDTTLDMDLDILVYDDKNNFIASSSSYDNSLEIADYIAQGGQTLTVKVRGYSIKQNAWTYFGIAWTTF